MKLKVLALCLVIALMATMLSSCEILKFTNHMLNIFGPEDENEVNVDLNIVIPGNGSGSGNGEHVHNWITIPGKPSTCTVNGYTEKIVCDTCGEVRVESTKIVLAPHTYDDSSDRICNVCGYTRNCTHAQTTVIPGYPATETENGLTDGKRCNFCNETVVYQMTLYATGTAGLTYEVSEDKTGYIVTGITSRDNPSIYIPERYDGRPVVGIGNYAFNDCSFITSIVISDGVTRIGFRSFQNCQNLESIVIPESVTYIDEGAFVDCDKLASISLPSGITTITNAMFSSCNSLTDIVIPDGVTSIDAYAFNWCTELKNIVIPNSVTSIGDYAFQYCEKLENITIGNKVTSIGTYAFKECRRLKSIVLPDSVTSIGEYAFYNCYNLTSVTIGKGVKSIGEGAFLNCSNLTSVVFPNSLRSIGASAFASCGLTTVVIPAGVTSIGVCAFTGCDRVESITVAKGNTVYHSAGNCLIEMASKTLISGCKNSVIPADGSVTCIGDGAFNGCSGLTSIVIPDSVTTIGRDGFSSCISLESIVIPSSVTSVGNSVFSYCINLKNITFEGTTAQWKAISKGGSWSYNIGDYTIYCTDGTIAKDGTVTYN